MRLLIACAILVVAVVLSVRFGDRRSAPSRVKTVAASSSCGRALIQDWFQNGRIDRSYARPCYEAALRLVPEVGYGLSLVEDIETRLR